MPYNPSNWYWIVAGSTTQVFSSASGTLVATSDATYQAWLAAGNLPSRIASWAELHDVLAAQAPAAWARALTTLEASGALTPQQMLAARLATPVQVTSTANNATLGGSYAVDPVSQVKITAIAAGIAAGKGLPGGGATVGIADAAGAVHNFDASDYLNFAAAIESYVYQLYTTEGVLLAGGSANWTAASLTIP